MNRSIIKKIVGAVTVAVVLGFAVGANAQGFDSESDFQWVLLNDVASMATISEQVFDGAIPPAGGSGNYVMITNYIGNKKIVNIPPSISGKPVIAIHGYVGDLESEGAFMGRQLTRVTIPNSVTVVNPMAFSFNQLTTITIGANVDVGEGYDDDASFAGGFAVAYNSGGKQAGTYVLRNGRWIRQ